ncbi:MAG: glycosyltransferase [Patescibacteria group bacterium]
MSQSPNLLTIGFSKRSLLDGSRDQERQVAYARRLSSLHAVIFTRKSDGFKEVVQKGNTFFYPTNARTKIGMLWAAHKIGRRILKDAPAGSEWFVSSQDPFETSLVGRALAWRFAVKHHVQVHGDLFGRFWRRESLLNRLRYWYGVYLVKQASGIRVVSQRIKSSLIKLGVSEAKISVLPIQFSLQRYLRIGANRNTSAGDRCRFIYVGRLSPEKNVTLLLQSFHELAQSVSGASLTIVGDGPERIALEQQVADYQLTDKVTFTGWNEQVEEVLAEHDCLLLSSNHEGWAMVLIEAMAAGLPVITTDVGCAGEIVQDQIHGFVVPVGDLEAYTQALSVMASDQPTRQRFSQAAYQTVQSLELGEESYLDTWVAALTRS